MDKVIAKKDMSIRDIEDGSLPPLEINKGDVGTITGWTDSTNGPAMDIEFEQGELFIYPLAFDRYFERLNK